MDRSSTQFSGGELPEGNTETETQTQSKNNNIHEKEIL